MPICDKCGEDKIEHGFFAHQKFCKGVDDDDIDKPVYLEPIDEDEEIKEEDVNNPIREVPKEEVVSVKPVLEVPKEEVVSVKPVDPEIEKLRKALGELTEEHNELLNDMSALRSEIKLPDPDVIEKLEVLRNKIDDIEEVQEKNHEVEDLKESNRKIAERIENISIDYNNLRKEVLNGKASMAENLKQMMEKISQMPVEKQGVAIQQLEDFNEALPESMKSNFDEMRLAIEKIYSEDGDKITNLKNEVEELKVKSAQPIVILEIKELRDEIKFMKADLENRLARDQTRAENIERTIPQPGDQKPKLKQNLVRTDNGTWNDVAVKILAITGIFLILLWAFL